MNKVGIFFIVEPGTLENRAEILVKSLRTFGGLDPSYSLYAFQPRRSGALKRQTYELFKRNQVVFEKVNLNRKFFFYPVANKIMAGAYFEHRFPQYESVIFLDTDVLVAAPIEELISHNHIKVSPPVDAAHLETLLGEEPDPFWKLAFSTFGLSLADFWETTTLSDQKKIYSYFSSGVVSYPRKKYLFSQLEEMLFKLFSQREILQVPFIKLFFTDQVLLACHLAMNKMQDEVTELPIEWNYPICLTTSNLENAKIIHFQDFFEKNSTEIMPEHIRQLMQGIRTSVTKKPAWLRCKEILRYQLFKLALFLN